MRAGAEIYEYQPTMYRINDEANLNVYDRNFALEQVRIFRQDLSMSRQVSLRDWENRSLVDKALDFAASLLRSQL